MVWPFGTVTDEGGTGPGVKRWGMVAMREGCRRNVEQPVSEMARVGELVDRLVKLDGLLHPAAPDAG